MSEAIIERTALAVTFFIEGSEDGSLPSYRDTLHIEMPEGSSVEDAQKQTSSLIRERYDNWSNHILNPPVVEETPGPNRDEVLVQAKEALEQAQYSIQMLIDSKE